MATPIVAPNKSRAFAKAFAILFDNVSSRTHTMDVGGVTPQKIRGKMWLSAGVPSGGTGISDGDFCLDTTNNDVYRYDSGDAWYKLNVVS